MSNIAYYITHPQVNIDPQIDVPKWGLSNVGKERVTALVQNLKLSERDNHSFTVVSSNEVKAIETATPLVDYFDCKLIIDPRMGENDRSATGFLEPESFEDVANQFFKNPDTSIRGWECARDAQNRIVDRFQSHIAQSPNETMIFVGHGAVGTLLYCHLTGENIDRKFDQSGGGGNFFKIDTKAKVALSHWQPIEEFTL
ncbi:MAG: histidine phosphatase family protein [Lentilitoribacter sp.]